MYEESQTGLFSQGALLFFIVCMIAGLVLGLMVHFKTQRHYRDAIDQIEELEDTK